MILTIIAIIIIIRRTRIMIRIMIRIIITIIMRIILRIVIIILRTHH